MVVVEVVVCGLHMVILLVLNVELKITLAEMVFPHCIREPQLILSLLEIHFLAESVVTGCV